MICCVGLRATLQLYESSCNSSCSILVLFVWRRRAFHDTLSLHRTVYGQKAVASSPGSMDSMPRSEQFEPPLPEIIGSAPAMQDVYRLVRLAAPRSAHVLLIGETGTGKEVIAKAVHKLS